MFNCAKFKTAEAKEHFATVIEMLSASAISDSTPIWANFGKNIFKIPRIAKKCLAKLYV